jgi:hypothetical protein
MSPTLQNVLADDAADDHIWSLSLQIISLLTHLVIIPGLALAARRLPLLHGVFIVVLAGIGNSIVYHACIFQEGEGCLAPLATLQLMDHITAEGTVFASAVIFLHPRSATELNLLLFGGIYLLALLKLYWDTALFVATYLAILSVPIVMRNAPAMRTTYLVPLVVLIWTGAVAFFFFYVTADTALNHSLWHTFAYLSFDLCVALALALRAERDLPGDRGLEPEQK